MKPEFASEQSIRVEFLIDELSKQVVPGTMKKIKCLVSNILGPRHIEFLTPVSGPIYRKEGTFYVLVDRSDPSGLPIAKEIQPIGAAYKLLTEGVAKVKFPKCLVGERGKLLLERDEQCVQAEFVLEVAYKLIDELNSIQCSLNLCKDGTALPPSNYDTNCSIRRAYEDAQEAKDFLSTWRDDRYSTERCWQQVRSELKKQSSESSYLERLDAAIKERSAKEYVAKWEKGKDRKGFDKQVYELMFDELYSFVRQIQMELFGLNELHSGSEMAKSQKSLAFLKLDGLDEWLRDVMPPLHEFKDKENLPTIMNRLLEFDQEFHEFRENDDFQYSPGQGPCDRLGTKIVEWKEKIRVAIDESLETADLVTQFKPLQDGPADPYSWRQDGSIVLRGIDERLFLVLQALWKADGKELSLDELKHAINSEWTPDRSRLGELQKIFTDLRREAAEIVRWKLTLPTKSGNPKLEPTNERPPEKKSRSKLGKSV